MDSNCKRLSKLHSQTGSSLILMTSVIFFIIAIAFTMLFMSLTYYTLNKRFQASENLYYETARATPVTAKYLNTCIDSSFIKASTTDMWWTSSDSSQRFKDMTTDFWNWHVDGKYTLQVASLTDFRDIIGPILEQKTSDNIIIREALEDIYLKMVANMGTGTTNIFNNTSIYGTIVADLQDRLTEEVTNRYRITDAKLVPGGAVNTNAVAWLNEVLSPTAGPYADGTFPYYTEDMTSTGKSIMDVPSYITYSVAAENPTYKITKKVEYKFEAFTKQISGAVAVGGGGGTDPNGDATVASYSYPLFSNVLAATGKINFISPADTTIMGSAYAFGDATGGVKFDGGNVMINNSVAQKGALITRGNMEIPDTNMGMVVIENKAICNNFNYLSAFGFYLGLENFTKDSNEDYLATFTNAIGDDTVNITGNYYGLDSSSTIGQNANGTDILVGVDRNGDFIIDDTDLDGDNLPDDTIGDKLICPDIYANARKDTAKSYVSFLKTYNDADPFAAISRESEYTDAGNTSGGLPSSSIIYGRDTANMYFIYINNEPSNTVTINENPTDTLGNINAADIDGYSGIIYSRGGINVYGSGAIANPTKNMTYAANSGNSYVRLPPAEPTYNDYYNGWYITLAKGTTTVTRKVTDYVGSNRYAYVDSAWGYNFTTTSPCSTYTLTNSPPLTFNGSIISCGGDVTIGDPAYNNPISLGDIDSATFNTILNSNSWDDCSPDFSIEKVKKFFSPGSVPTTTFGAAPVVGGGSSSQYVRLLSQREIK